VSPQPIRARLLAGALAGALSMAPAVSDAHDPAASSDDRCASVFLLGDLAREVLDIFIGPRSPDVNSRPSDGHVFYGNVAYESYPNSEARRLYHSPPSAFGKLFCR